MRVDDMIRKTVVYVGDANDKPFVPHGTGFIAITYIEDKAFQCVVTARHVLEGIGPDVHLRLNDSTGAAKVIPLKGTDWHPHPSGKVDLVACPTLIPREQLDIMYLNIEDSNFMFFDYDIVDDGAEYDLGDDIIVVGMFQQRMGQSKILPIIRTGTIAAMPDEEIETAFGHHKAYLIEVKSIDGLSGSPVFAVNSIIRIKDRKLTAQSPIMFKFIGCLLGHDEVINRKDRIAIKPTGEFMEEGIQTLLNTGIGIVAPADLVRETIKHPEMEKGRMESLQRKDRERRYMPDSAAPARQEPPTTEDNPSHREDFRRLLDAAAKTRPQGDET